MKKTKVVFIINQLDAFDSDDMREYKEREYKMFLKRKKMLLNRKKAKNERDKKAKKNNH